MTAVVHSMGKPPPLPPPPPQGLPLLSKLDYPWGPPPPFVQAILPVGYRG